MGAPSRVLCVTSDPDVQSDLLRALAAPGVVVECVPCGRDALEIVARAGRVAALLVDHHLRDMVASEFVSCLRAGGFGGSVAIVSAPAAPEDRASYRAHGVKTFIELPLTSLLQW